MRFQPLRIFERYVLRQVTGPLLTAMLVGLLILVAERLVIVLAETMGKKNSFSIVFELISYWLPVIPAWFCLQHLRSKGTV